VSAAAAAILVLAQAPGAATLAIHPPHLHLDSATDAQAFLAILTSPAGISEDVTDRVQATVDDGQSAALLGNTLRPLRDGVTSLELRLGDLTATAPLVVRGAERTPAVTFRVDVLPVLTVAGCNSGACHGSARGQDGFHLSLFGYDPEGDYQALTRQFPGRRLNRAFPDRSMLLEKATAAVAHSGGKRFEPSSDEYQTLHAWIAGGAAPDPAGLPTVTSIELYPPRIVFGGAGQDLRLLVRAHLSDGTDRDVTGLAVLRSNNDVSARLAPGGRLRSGQRGEAFITASYQSRTVGVPVVVLEGGLDFVCEDPAEGLLPATPIDDLVNAKLRTLRMNPSPLCSDEEFLRRIWLDLVGLLPSPQERAEFLADPDPGRRRTLAERLLQRREFVDLWVMQWAELLQIRSNNEISPKAALLYFEWVRNALGSGVPLDQMVRDLLGATGGSFAAPATNLYQNQTDTLVLAESVAQSFLGIRVQCAQCHNHPFDRWTQDDYYGFAAFFAQVGRKRGEDQREVIVFNRGSGEVTHPVGGRQVRPRFLGGPEPDLQGRDRRQVLAEWLTAPENPWFARSVANRVWAHFMGVGIVEPVDDFRVSNPPSNGPLLDALARRLVDVRFDVRALVRDIVNSRTYQRSTERNDSNRTDERNFAHAQVRRLRAETLLDVVCQVTEMPEKLQGLPLGARAVEIADGTTSTYFLSTFGRAPRETACACEVSREPSLSQALHLLNGQTISTKVQQGPVVATLAELPPAEALERLYLRCLCRAPRPEEAAALAPFLDPAGDRVTALEDLFWSILNSREFVFNH
jgi:hypothetical protein